MGTGFVGEGEEQQRTWKIENCELRIQYRGSIAGVE
jgi:hypothetical protein